MDLDNFRNYQRLHLDLSEGINLFYGDNAQGKTNILEAVFLSSVSRSHRGARDKEMIRFGNEESHIKLIAEKDGKEYRIDVHLRQEKNKGIAVNSVPVRKARDFIGTLSTVLFSPEDLQIVKEGPQERRNFLDRELCQLDPIYLDASIRYRRILENRNQLLRDSYMEPSLLDTLDVWDEQLVRTGTEIIETREQFVSELREIVLPIHEKLSGGKEKLTVSYEPNVRSEEFREALLSARERDRKQKTTTVGPHRDDLAFLITTDEGTEKEQKIDARIYGSQGQQRTCALSLKMAEIEIVERRTGDPPVLLLDDVLSELDSGRQQFLLDSIRGIQTLLTCTGLEEMIGHHIRTDRVFRVENGIVTYEEQKEVQ